MIEIARKSGRKKNEHRIVLNRQWKQRNGHIVVDKLLKMACKKSMGTTWLGDNSAQKNRPKYWIDLKIGRNVFVRIKLRHIFLSLCCSESVVADLWLGFFRITESIFCLWMKTILIHLSVSLNIFIYSPEYIISMYKKGLCVPLLNQRHT